MILYYWKDSLVDYKEEINYYIDYQQKTVDSKIIIFSLMLYVWKSMPIALF
jgi:hypothetical protein